MISSLPEGKDSIITISKKQTSVPEQDKTVSTISRQKDIIKTSLLEHTDIITSNLNQKETMITAPNKINIITSLLEQKDIITSIPGQKEKMTSIPNKINIISSVSEQNKKDIITTILKQINIITSLPKQEDIITTFPKKVNEITSVPKQKTITNISNKINILTTILEKNNSTTIIPNHINDILSIPEQKSTIITLIQPNNTETNLPKKNFGLTTISEQYNFVSTFPKQNEEVSTYPKINDSIKSIPIQNDIVTTVSQLNNISFPGQKDTMKIETTVPTSKESFPAPTNLTIIKNTEQIAQGNLDNIGNPIIILLGFSNFVIDKKNSFISFYIYFVPVKNYLHSQKIRFPINIRYISLLRLLQSKEAICTLKNIHQSNQNKYLCIVQAETLNIKKIESNLEITFESDDDVVIVGITPFAKMFMDNLQFINNKDLFETKIYIMDHSTYKQYDEKLINITGIIQEPKPNFKNYTNFELMINLNSAEEKEAKLDCNIIEIIGNNYTLHCKINKNIDGDLQASVSYIDNDLLVINFETGFDSKINFKEKYTKFNKMYYSRKSDQIKSTAIIVISLVIIIIVASLIVIIFIIFKRKKKNNKRHIQDSSRETININ